MSEQSYMVYEPRETQKDLVARADEVVFVRDGFSFWAMVLPIFWMIYHRMWLALAGFVVTFLSLVLLGELFGAAPENDGFLFLGLSVIFSFLANDIRRIYLERHDYRLVGSLAGFSQTECERRFFNSWSPLFKTIRNEGTGSDIEAAL